MTHISNEMRFGMSLPKIGNTRTPPPGYKKTDDRISTVGRLFVGSTVNNRRRAAGPRESPAAEAHKYRTKKRHRRARRGRLDGVLT